MFAIINKNMHVFIFQFNDYDKIDKFRESSLCSVKLKN